MRIPRTDVAVREKFAIDLFEQEPNLSIPKANERLKVKFGSRIRNQRLYQIREVARNKLRAKAVAPKAFESAARAGGLIEQRRDGAAFYPPVVTPDAQVGFPQGPPPPVMETAAIPEFEGAIINIRSTEDAAFLKNAFREISEQGLAHLDVSHVTSDHHHAVVTKRIS